MGLTRLGIYFCDRDGISMQEYGYPEILMFSDAPHAVLVTESLAEYTTGGTYPSYIVSTI
jgi:hypothetical protein